MNLKLAEELQCDRHRLETDTTPEPAKFTALKKAPDFQAFVCELRKVKENA